MKAVSIGELAVDWLSLTRGESLMTAKNFYRYLGGNATNVAVGMARLGLDSAIVSRVGDDIHGQYLLHKLKEENVDASLVEIDPTIPTAQCYMTRKADGSPVYDNWPTPNASKLLQAEHLPPEIFPNSWLWHTAAVTLIAKPRREAILSIMKSVASADKIISFDGCFPDVDSEGGRNAAYELMAFADIIKLNLAELHYWSQCPAGTSIPRMVAKLQTRMKPAIIIITLAELGAELWKGDDKRFCEPYKVESIGDVGPGDAFIAGLIYGLSTLENGLCSRTRLYQLTLNQWLDLARYGAIAGALVTRSHSATESFPSLSELTELHRIWCAASANSEN